jgi:hypothetical protein
MNMNAKNRCADIWQAECERAGFNAAALLRIARMYPSQAAILESSAACLGRPMKNWTRSHLHSSGVRGPRGPSPGLGTTICSVAFANTLFRR